MKHNISETKLETNNLQLNAEIIVYIRKSNQFITISLSALDRLVYLLQYRLSFFFFFFFFYFFFFFFFFFTLQFDSYT